MMKKWFVIGCLLLFSVAAMAQINAESRYGVRRTFPGIGVKVGVFMPYYHYGNRDDLNQLSMDTAWLNRIRRVVGVQLELPMGESAYFTPELVWTQRGDARIFNNVPSGQDLSYLANVNYLDLRLPIAVVIPVKSPVRPYILGGAEFSVVMPYLDTLPIIKIPLNLSGTINGIDVNASNMAPFDLGVFGGAGLRYTLDFDRFSLVMKLEAAYHLGLLNTYADREIHSQAPAANLGNGGTHYSVGRRTNRGWEGAFTLVLPLHFKAGDACSSFGSRVYGHSRRRAGSYGF